ncbi:MAG: SMI1/KNR4 family protein [Myxococcota bacterium]
MDSSTLHRALQRAGVETATGLAGEEVERIEAEFSFLFPPDLRSFLEQAVPVSPGWADWRAPDRDALKKRLEWPYEGMRFDIEHNGFWMDGWGPRPKNMSDRFETAHRAVGVAPTLIPIVGYRYIPERPHQSGNPVFSVHQTDIIDYGVDLADFFANEVPQAFGRAGYVLGRDPRPIEFWSELG